MTPNITVFFMSRFWGLIRRQISGGEAEQGRHSSAQGAQGQGQPSPRLIRGGPGNHEDAVDDGADAEAQGAARAAVSDRGQVGFGIELDSLWMGVHVIDVPCGKGQNHSHFSTCISCSEALGDVLVHSGAAAIATVRLAGKKPHDSAPGWAARDDSGPCSSGSQGHFPVQRWCYSTALCQGTLGHTCGCRAVLAAGTSRLFWFFIVSKAQTI